MVTKEELKKSPDRQLSDDELGKVAGGKRGDIKYVDTYTAECPHCHHVAKRVDTWYEDQGWKIESEDNCAGCGAKIVWYTGALKTDFTLGQFTRTSNTNYTREE